MSALNFAAPDIGIDLGTCTTQVVVRGKGIVLSEPTIVLVNADDPRRVRAVGDDAREMLGKTTDGVRVVRPMREGIITDFDMTEILLQYYVRKAIGSSYLVKPRMVLSYPCSISAIEKRAVAEAARYAGARAVYMLEKPFLSAFGSNLPIDTAKGVLVVDIGGGTTDVALISVSGIVIQRSIRVGGVKMDEAIANYIKLHSAVLIGDRTAEEVKLDLGSALPLLTERKARVRGRDMVTNLPQIVEINSTMVYEALQEPCMAIVEAIKWVLERTPPELAGSMVTDGIYLTGGGAQLYGMENFIENEIGLKAHLRSDPMYAVSTGLDETLKNFDTLSRMDILQES